MAYEIDGKVYRNLQEQVAENTKHINELSYGNIYKGPYPTLTDIPQEELIKGSIFLIGNKTDGYEMYKCLETDNRLYQDLGKFGAMGPKGDKGDKGEQGEQGATGNEGPQGETGNGILRIFLDQVIGQEKHYVIEFTNGDRFNYVVSDGQQGIQGPAGPVGPQGPQGEVGPQGPVANPLYEHNIRLQYHYNSGSNIYKANVTLRIINSSSESITTFTDLENILDQASNGKRIMANGEYYYYPADGSVSYTYKCSLYCCYADYDGVTEGPFRVVFDTAEPNKHGLYISADGDERCTVTDYVRQLI